MTPIERWLVMLLLCLSGSIIYLLPFLSEFFYVPMQEAFGFTKTQMGALSSTFGVVALVGYFPGGWVADRFSSRKLIAISLFLTGAAGFLFADFPSFQVCLLLFGFWGLSTAFVFWAAMVKATRNWAPKEEQGRAFGILEGGRGVTDLAAATILLSLFAYRGGNVLALANVIQILSVAVIALAVLVWLVLKDDKLNAGPGTAASPTISIAQVLLVLRMPTVWLIAIIILAAYSGLWGTIYFTPYATEAFAMGSILGGAIGVGKLWMKPFAAILAGLVADKVGASKTVFASFVVMTAGFLIFAIIPGNEALIALLVVNVAIISAAVFALRGIYFALLEQGGVPMAVTGTATGVVSVIGYTPDIFMPMVGGIILDADPGAGGYQNLFLFVSCISLVGTAAAFAIYRRTRLNSAIQQPLS